MANVETAPATLDTGELAQTIEIAAAADAHTIGEYVDSVRFMSSTLMQTEGPMKDVADELEDNAASVEDAADGALGIQVDTLEPGLNGFTVVGGEESDITVNADLLTVTDTTQLAETIDHELRHNDQVELQTGGQETILVTENGEHVEDLTLLYEADTETHTAETFGHRQDQPQMYAQAYEIGVHVQEDHKDQWRDTLTESGDIGALQAEIWKEGLQSGKLSMEDLITQADATGYTDEAARVMSDALKNGTYSTAA